MIAKATYRVRMLAAGLLLLSAFWNVQPACAQNKPPLEYQLKAAFLFNFTRFIHWPASAYASSDAPFVIGIVGNDPFGNYLDDLVNGELADGHRIMVRRYPEGADLTDCQLLFISMGDVAKLKAILSTTAHQDILTVGDTDSFTSSGGMIRLFKEDNRIKIEIRLATVKMAQLEVSAKLLQVAKVK